jgi:hypothetical protein
MKLQGMCRLLQQTVTHARIVENRCRRRWVFCIPIIFIASLAGCSTPDPSGQELRVKWKRNAVYEIQHLSMERAINHDLEQALQRKQAAEPIIDLHSLPIWHDETQSNLEAACETVLTEFAADTNELIRCDASVALSRMGTTSALAKALCILTNDPSARVRAEVAGAIAEMLSINLWERTHPPQTNNLPGFHVSITRCFRSLESLPKDTDPEAIAELLAKVFLTDDGRYQHQYTDRFWLLPFIKSKSVVTFNVRDSIAEVMRWNGMYCPVFVQAVNSGLGSTNKHLAAQSEIIKSEWLRTSARETRDDEIREAVFRWQFMHNASSQQTNAHVYFLAIGVEFSDPTDEFMKRFVEHKHPRSKAFRIHHRGPRKSGG